MEEDCVFCKIVRGEIDSEKILDNEDFIVIKDINPRVDGHLLVISKRHFETFMDMEQGFYEEFLITIKQAVEKLGIKDFNLVLNNGKIAGQLVSHVHMHILPREKGDDFNLNV